jgi:hypothetical protein
VTLADLEAFLPPDKAAATLTTLDVDRDGQVSLHDMREAVLQASVSCLNMSVVLLTTALHMSQIVVSTGNACQHDEKSSSIAMRSTAQPRHLD